MFKLYCRIFKKQTKVSNYSNYFFFNYMFMEKDIKRGNQWRGRLQMICFSLMFCKFSTLRLLFLCLLEAAQVSAQALVNSWSTGY